MLEHVWPGNVRELIHVLKRAGIQLPGPRIDEEIEAIIKGAIEEDGQKPCGAPPEKFLRSFFQKVGGAHNP